MLINKAVYQNPNSGKYYCTDEEGIHTVFINSDFDKSTAKTDKNGKTYWVLAVEAIVTKNGYHCYRYNINNK